MHDEALLHDVMTHAFFILDGKALGTMSIAMVHSDIERGMGEISVFILFMLKSWGRCGENKIDF